MMKSLLVLSAVFSLTSNAQTREIRIDRVGGSMEKMPMQSQFEATLKNGEIDLSNCYSYAATQYWDTYRYVNGSFADRMFFKPSSPDFASIVSSSIKVKGGDGDMKGGQYTQVVDYLNQNGNCSLSHVKSQPIYDLAVMYYFTGLAAYARHLPIESARSPIQSSPGLEFMEHHRIEVVTKVMVQNTQILQQYGQLKSVLMQEMKRLNRPIEGAALEAKLFKSASPDDFLIDALGVDCPQTEKVAAAVAPYHNESLQDRISDYFRTHTAEPKNAAENYMLEKDIQRIQNHFGDKLARDLQFHFIQGGSMALPVMIGYCSGVLSQGLDFQGVQSALHGGPCGGHASIITGVRLSANNTVSEVLIRNSYGTTCKIYSKDLECEAGSMWLPLQALQANLMDYAM